MTQRFYTIDQVKQANRESGLYWFEKSTLRFFNSRVNQTTYTREDGGCYFVSSEQQPGTSLPRLYTVRMATYSGHIKTLGDFQGFTTLARAARAIVRLQKPEAKGFAAMLSCFGCWSVEI